jgi:hypothetical protein
VQDLACDWGHDDIGFLAGPQNFILHKHHIGKAPVQEKARIQRRLMSFAVSKSAKHDEFD